MHLQKSKKTIRAVTGIYNKLILSRGYTMFEDKVFCVLRITTSIAWFIRVPELCLCAPNAAGQHHPLVLHAFTDVYCWSAGCLPTPALILSRS